MSNHIEMLSAIVGELEGEPIADPPSLKEELERKTIETVEFLVRRHDQGRLSDSEFFVGLNTLWSMAAGLVEKKTMELISAAQSEVNNPTPKQMRAFIKGDRIAIITFNEKDAICHHYFSDSQYKIKKIDRAFPSEELHTINNHMEEAAKTILAKGYTEV